jgi:DNA polymerase-3 subunit delta'
MTTIPGLKLSDAEIETAFDEQGGAPYAVFDFGAARHNKDDKDELALSIAASRLLLQAMAQGSRLPWLETAEKIHKAHLGYLLATMQRWVADLQAVACSGFPRYYPRHLSTLQNLSQQANEIKLLAFWKSLLQARRSENHPLANRIQIEALLSQYQQVFESQ